MHENIIATSATEHPVMPPFSAICLPQPKRPASRRAVHLQAVARLLSRRRCRGWRRGGRGRGRRCRSWRGSRGRRRSWLRRRSRRCRGRSRRAGGRRLSRGGRMLAAASAKDIIRNHGQDNDNKGDQPSAAATTATRGGRRARRGERVVRVRHETCPPWMKVIKITAINALSPHRVSRGRTESAEKPAFSGPPAARRLS